MHITVRYLITCYNIRVYNYSYSQWGIAVLWTRELQSNSRIWFCAWSKFKRRKSDKPKLTTPISYCFIKWPISCERKGGLTTGTNMNLAGQWICFKRFFFKCVQTTVTVMFSTNCMRRHPQSLCFVALNEGSKVIFVLMCQCTIRLYVIIIVSVCLYAAWITVCEKKSRNV